MRLPVRGAVVLLACAALGACGTTVPVTSQGSLGGGAGLSGPAGTGLDATGAPVGGTTGLAGSTGGAGSGTSGTGAASGPGGTTGSASSGTAGVGGAPGTTGTTGAGGAVHYGQGITAASVIVGFGYDPNADATNETIASGLGTGNIKGMIEAYAGAINARGGIAGKKVVLDPWAINTQAADYNAELDRACRHWTQDTKAFAVLTGGAPEFTQCLEKGGVMGIEVNLTISSDEDFAKAPHYFEPATLSLERRGRNLPPALAAQGWFGPGKPVVGVLSYDTVGFRRAVEKELLPGLAAVGHAVSPDNVQLVSYPSSYGEYGGLASAISSAVLRFQTNRVTHVVVLDAKGVATLFLMTNAESQQYRPQYGLDSASGVQTLYEGGNISAQQAANATGIGWLPSLDVPAARNPTNPAAKACLAFFDEKGFAASNNNGRAVQYGICDTFEALERSLAGGAPDRDAATRALEAVGDDFPAATALRTGFRPGRHDGVTGYRFLRWDPECGCMSYSGTTRPTR